MSLLEICLATFNSQKYLSEQLESLFRQTCQDFTLLISDDGSTDLTLNIVSEFEHRYPGRIRRIESTVRAGGARANFSRLIDCLTADYAMFCDHDDVWLPHKVALSLERIKLLESQAGPNAATLVHTNLLVVGPELQTLSPSFFLYQHIDPTRHGLCSVLMSNVVVGNTIIANRALYERARPVPSEAAMHDYWLTLVAATIGSINYVPETPILYRQHGKNVIGTEAWGIRYFRDRAWQTLFGSERRRRLEQLSGQAAALLSRFGNDMTPDQYQATSTLANLWRFKRWFRFAKLLRHGLLLNGIVRNVALFVVVTRRDIQPQSSEKRM